MNDQTTPTKRLSLSEIVHLLLTRGGGERSSVTISVNAEGDVLHEVTVRTGDESDVLTVEDCERKALAVHERLASTFPPPNGRFTGSDYSLTRNAKGETQVAVTVKAAKGSGESELDIAEAKAREAYDRLRARYPLASGYTGGPPPDEDESTTRAAKGADDGGQE